MLPQPQMFTLVNTTVVKRPRISSSCFVCSKCCSELRKVAKQFCAKLTQLLVYAYVTVRARSTHHQPTYDELPRASEHIKITIESFWKIS